MELFLESPTVVRLQGFDKAVLERLLTYKDKRTEYELKKFKHAHWFSQQHGEEAYQERLAELKAAQIKSLVFEDENGLWTHSGLLPYLQVQFPHATSSVGVEYPPGRNIPWAKIPQHTLRDYQIKALEELQAKPHSAVELATGLGKTQLLLQMAKFYGQQTLIMAPSVSIAEQIFDLFKTHFGIKYVGKFFSGKKQLGKLFTVAVAASLTRVEPDSDAWEHLSQTKVFMADESHLVAADTLAKICLSLVKDAPYRHFFSGTQMRGDGLGKLLLGITGEIVHRMSVREGVNLGWLAKPNFFMINTRSDSTFASRDVNEMTRHHLFSNSHVNRIAARIVNRSIRLLGHQALILIDELDQFGKILPYLEVPAAFAHAGVTADNRASVPGAYWKSDPKDLVAQFNAGTIPLLIGTSCVSIGTDIKPVKTLIYLRGGKSEVEVKQGIGRSTRMVPGKTFCNIFDFSVENIDDMQRHADARKEIYESIYGPVITLNEEQV